MASLTGLFLRPDDLPAGMECVRDARDSDAAPPGTSPTDGGWKRAGWANWVGLADADLYRVDDVRWLFPTEGRARRWHEREAARATAVAGPAVAPVRGWECLSSAFGRPATGFIHVLTVGPVVARLYALTGEDADLDGGYVLALAEVVVARMARFVARARV